MTSNGVSGSGSGSGSSSSSKGRGVLWRLQETLHLLDIWGEQNMQDQLRNTYQNLECFEYIAQEMARRGYRRTAVECRSKAKALRLAYKRVIDHNAKAGSNQMTCPFYDQLHQILRGDASAKSKWVPQRLSFQDGSQQEAALAPPQTVSEDVMSHDFPVIDDDGQYIKQEDTETTVGTDNGIEEMREMGGENIPQGKEESSNESWGRNLDSQRPQVSPEEQDSFSCVDPVEANSPLSPSPTPMVRSRKKKKTDVMFEQFLQQSREQHKELLLEMARDREVALDFLKSFKEDAAEHREESEHLTETMYTQNETLKGLVANLNSLIDAFVNQSQNRHCSNTSHSTAMQ